MKYLALVVLLFPCLALADTSVSDVPTEPASNQVSVEIGEFWNGASGNLFSGMGLRFARQVVGGILNSRDALTVESGLSYYNVVDYVAQGDAYTVLPVSAVVQYGRVFGESFRPYLYAGAIKNFVVASGGGNGFGQNELNGLAPAVGVGFSVFFKGLIARADFGTDVLGVGLAYAF